MTNPTQTSTRPQFPRVGVMGAGQLGRMFAQAAVSLGVQVRFLTSSDSGSTSGLGETVLGRWDDPEVLRRFARGCDVVTVENEWAPVGALLDAVPDVILRPGRAALTQIADKGRQKRVLEAAGLPVAEYRLAADVDAVRAAAAEFGCPLILKRREGSYDGYGNFTVKDPSHVEEGFRRLAGPEGVLVEKFVPFEVELAA